MGESTALCVVVGGAIYEQYAAQLIDSARDFFHPTEHIEFHTIPGDEGWPNGTMMRYHHLLDNLPDTDYIFHIDADARFEFPVGPEILPVGWMTATAHPGYVNKHRDEWPFEDREDSRCYVAPERRRQYICGGFLGGSFTSFQVFARAVAAKIDYDLSIGITPKWHDESAANAVIAAYGDGRPNVLLSPAYAYPDDASWYRTWWPHEYDRKIVMLDKTQAERGDR